MPRPGRGASDDEGSVVTLLPYPLDESGGIAAFVRSLLSTLKSEYGAPFLLVAPARADAGQSTRTGQFRFAATALRALSQIRPRAVQNHESLPLLGAALLWKLLALGRVRVIHTVHVDPAEQKSWPKRALIGLLYALCDRVVVVSQDTRRRLSNMALPLRANVDVIYGAPPVIERATADAVAGFAAAFGLGPGPVICQITRFYYPLKVKGAAQLLAAFGPVRAAVPDAQLLLVGHGPLWQEFRAMHGLQAAADGVTLTGYVDDPLLPMLLADIYCHITFQDALPIVVMEAMSLGKTVVASAIGGIPEVIEHEVTGMLTNADTAELSRTLIGLLQAPKQAEALGRNAQNAISARLSWSKCAAQYAQLYGLISPPKQARTIPTIQRTEPDDRHSHGISAIGAVG